MHIYAYWSNVRSAVTLGLRLRDVDVLTSQEDGTRTLSDSDLLDRAAVLERVLFTHDDDLLRHTQLARKPGNLVDTNKVNSIDHKRLTDWGSAVFVFGVVLSTLIAIPNRPGARALQTSDRSSSSREEAYRANNTGVALLEQFKYKEAAEAFRRALQIDPKLAIASVNLSIAFFNEPNFDVALREARAAAESLPNSPQAHYIMGLIAKAQNRVDDAITSFKRVLQIDPEDVGANINLGQLYANQRKYAEAIASFRIALTIEPYSVTATYNMALALLRAGQRDDGQRLMQQFQTLRNAGYGTTLGQNYLEQGRYAEAVSSTGAEPDLVNTNTPEVTFTDASLSVLPRDSGTARPGGTSSPFGRSFKPSELTDTAKRELVSALAGGVAAFDYDGDGDSDLLEVSSGGQRLYRNDAGKLTDVTETSGLVTSDPASIGIGAVAGDYDNDNRPDLFVLRYGRSSLYHNQGNGRFADVTSAARVPASSHLALSAAFVDVDHDGDLDIFVAGSIDFGRTGQVDAGQTLTFPDNFAGAPNLLLRNDGDGKFTDITSSARIAGPNRSIAVVPTDYNNRRDIDLLVLNYDEPTALFSNQRDGTFQNVAAGVGLGERRRYTCGAAGDVNKDGLTDFFFGRISGPGVFALSDGKGRFVMTQAPAGSEDSSAAQFLDYDNDGLLDLTVLTRNGLRVLRNIGSNWSDVSSRAVSLPVAASGVRSLASFDLEGDGDVDLIAGLGPIRVARNEGGNRNRSLRVRLTGKVGNRGGVGAKVELRAGSLWQKLEICAASPAPSPTDIVFGLGLRASVDAVRVLWPAGIVQAELSPPPGQVFAITELDRKPSSCPYLYTWNGERFEFITDFMGGGEMGYAVAPGTWNHPDPDEYVRITSDQLKLRDGYYEIRVTNELEEVLYVDQLQLVAVAHPGETHLYPNEGMVSPPRAYKLFLTRDARPPIAAVDDHGHNVLSRVAKLDRQYPDDFKSLATRGYAEEHALTLNLGNLGRGRVLLLLTGWTDYAFSSDNVAAHQRGLSLKPPALQIRGRDGEWRTIIPNIGIPVGRPQTVVVDLTGKLPDGVHEVRLVTNMRVYWDQILVDTSSSNDAVQVKRLNASKADLRWRGFSAELTPDGREPFSYDYDRVTHSSPWKVMHGLYTREGDVLELLRGADDIFVIARPGDEIALRFDARSLPSLPAGWKHTFLLYADGFSKEMDINSAVPDHVLPLPFHGMTRYPYKRPEAYPMTRVRRDYLRRYNTRAVHRSLEPLL